MRPEKRSMAGGSRGRLGAAKLALLAWGISMPLRLLSRRISQTVFTLLFCLPTSFLFAQSVAVTTYHNDNRRTGLNSHETILTPANVGSSAFGLLHTVTLDDQVDAQPLVVPGVNITRVVHRAFTMWSM
jgi:hypothetical protein